MYAYYIETEIKPGKTLSLHDLPFHDGDRVEVVVVRSKPQGKSTQYPFHNKPVKLIDPSEPVAQDEWESLS